ncbi:MAG: 2'-5' RNA ligase family protein [Mycolicibacterium sp.]|uniref:2'-5' RNA ligase family protein n=1 Tax=Mycolicibacterium sp. TaxID=2320850 RepID=UPI003D10C83A
MVHSVELLFDRDTETAVRRIWDDLAELGLPSQAAHTAPSNRPHVTLTVADRMDDGVTAAVRPALGRLPLDCRIGAPMVFGGRVVTLVRLVVPSVELLALQAEVHRLCLPHMPDGPLPNVQHGAWTPHVTLARRMAPDQLPQALGLRRLGREIRGRAAALRHWDGNAKVVHPID